MSGRLATKFSFSTHSRKRRGAQPLGAPGSLWPAGQPSRHPTGNEATEAGGREAREAEAESRGIRPVLEEHPEPRPAAGLDPALVDPRSRDDRLLRATGWGTAAGLASLAASSYQALCALTQIKRTARATKPQKRACR
jgi:hypothetical protein